MRRGGDAGVTFCWPGVGAVLISLWFFIRCFSRVAASRSFRAASRVYPSASAARSPCNEDDACLRVAARGSPARNSCAHLDLKLWPPV